jgi:hypothetical protein
VLIIADRSARLGNRLWTFANVVAWCLENRRSVLNPGFVDFAAEYPFLTKRSRLPGWLVSTSITSRVLAALPRQIWDLVYRVNLRIHTFPHVALADNDMADIDEPNARQYLLDSSLVFLTGFYHTAADSLSKHAGDIRRLFQPHDSVRLRAELAIARAREQAQVVMGVHIRHGDYRTYCDGLMFYASEEYAEFMRYLTRLWPSRQVSFVVCSDEPQPAHVFDGLAVVRGPGDTYGDLHALALCDYIVGPSSTFSRWASFWGQTPLWMMDWRAAERHGTPIEKQPPISAFAVCSTATHLVDRRLLRQVSFAPS